MSSVIEWSVVCDEPGCKARVYASAVGGGSSDRSVREAALARAAAEGWQIEPDRFIRKRLDLCPEHRGS